MFFSPEKGHRYLIYRFCSFAEKGDILSVSRTKSPTEAGHDLEVLGNWMDARVHLLTDFHI